MDGKLSPTDVVPRDRLIVEAILSPIGDSVSEST